MSAAAELRARLASMPIVAILRGVRPDEVVAVATAVREAGVEIIEVPLNSPEPLVSIRLLVEALGGDALIGAGTVLSRSAVRGVAAAGGRLIVAPDTCVPVIREAKEAGLACAPGFLTPTEAFAAARAGADALKLFPARAIEPATLRAFGAVLPDLPVLAVGGVGPGDLAAWWEHGARGFGLGGSLYRAGDSPQAVAKKAQAAVASARELPRRGGKP